MAKNIFNLIKIIYEKPIANIIVNGERVNAFSPKTENKNIFIPLF